MTKKHPRVQSTRVPRWGKTLVVVRSSTRVKKKNQTFFSYQVVRPENADSKFKDSKYVMDLDLKSVEPSMKFTGAALDFFVDHWVRSQEGVYFAFGYPLHNAFSAAKLATSSRDFLATNKTTTATNMVKNFKWDTYPFILIPVVKEDHISFLVCERPMEIDGVLYHVDVLKPKPLQGNSHDCGVAAIYYMTKIRRFDQDCLRLDWSSQS
ncbi:hypothetical protein PHMEG_00017116 [Phytophthora megakarya]|uniref:Ubiquitin-like protease family profile domain-containing protein n=1 Tax=Phytophthora megakarya TaxID=4795 RepID=A0A225VZ67_9STRA|nr:hypothetical protein PHMEG_00017116 [Phytophthora megakarya]